ncbi:hypothetical protein [Haloechinothrix sp. LS1_15]|uniref:hypothetical protein n=1 Tax=Haloechinothrix sp. LS1_15 TaxID=2652248 RepID=UPI002944EF5E|nr:hypothetical protein [Haloechinothrix sp. LS1_15]MDV6012541.1 hypothetical protein [Haloechinothrix sp. LS1_15]
MPFPSLGRSRGRKRNSPESDTTASGERVSDHELDSYLKALSSDDGGKPLVPAVENTAEAETDPGLTPRRDALELRLQLNPVAGAQLHALAARHGMPVESLAQAWLLERLTQEGYS